MCNRQISALQESAVIYQVLHWAGYRTPTPPSFLQDKPPRSWAPTCRTDWWVSVPLKQIKALHAFKQKRIGKGKQFLGCFTSCLMTYITSVCKAITLSGSCPTKWILTPQRCFDKAPFYKALVHFHFSQEEEMQPGKTWERYKRVQYLFFEARNCHREFN